MFIYFTPTHMHTKERLKRLLDVGTHYVCHKAVSRGLLLNSTFQSVQYNVQVSYFLMNTQNLKPTGNLRKRQSLKQKW